MTFAHEAIAALPTGGNADPALIRNLVTRRFAYCLASTESATNFVVVDPTSGLVPLFLIQNNILFQYDSTDSTTTHDGVTCLVSSDGKRFKAATITPPYSVLTKGTTAQPGSPAVGDQYLIPTAATGTDWAGKDNQIGIYTAAGWRFAISPIGRFLYVKDETAFYHRNAAGTWTAGVGSIVLAAGSVNLTNVLGAKASFVVKVENQTTNAPPGSPTTPTAYIIGPSPTGAWAGNAGKLAICLVAGAFTIITPDTGDDVFDKGLGIPVRFNGTSWVSAVGALVGFSSTGLLPSPTQVFPGSAYYTLSGGTPPDTGKYHTRDDTGLVWQAKKTAAKLRFTYQFVFGAGSYSSVGLLRDSEVNAIIWSPSASAANTALQTIIFIVSASDALSHTYKIGVFLLSGAAVSISWSTLSIEEFA